MGLSHQELPLGAITGKDRAFLLFVMDNAENSSLRELLRNFKTNYAGGFPLDDTKCRNIVEIGIDAYLIKRGYHRK